MILLQGQDLSCFTTTISFRVRSVNELRRGCHGTRLCIFSYTQNEEGETLLWLRRLLHALDSILEQTNVGIAIINHPPNHQKWVEFQPSSWWVVHDIAIPTWSWYGYYWVYDCVYVSGPQLWHGPNMQPFEVPGSQGEPLQSVLGFWPAQSCKLGTGPPWCHGILTYSDHMGVSINWGIMVSKMVGLQWNIPSTWRIWGYPSFRKPPYRAPATQ